MTRYLYRFQTGMNTTTLLPLHDNINVVTKRQRLRLVEVGLRDHKLSAYSHFIMSFKLKCIQYQKVTRVINSVLDVARQKTRLYDAM